MKKHKYIFSLLMAIVMMAMSPQKLWADSQFTYTATSDLSSTFQSAFGSVSTVTCDTWTDANTAVTVTVAGTVTSIGESAFYFCDALTSITIPEGVTSIGGFAFCNCYALTSITIPSSVTSIGGSAFRGCSCLESITVAEGNTAYKSEDNCLLTKDGLTLITGCKNSVIPSGVTNISINAFHGCTGLTSITIPKSVTSIQTQVFERCSNLTTITVLSSNATLGKDALYNCDNLKTIYVPAGSVETYKAATNWSSYAAKIKAIPTLAFDLAITKAGATEATLSKELVKTITINRSAAGAAQVAAQSGSEEVTPTALEHLARYDFTITKLPVLQPGEDDLSGGIVAGAKRRVATAATPPSEPTLNGPALVVGTATAYTTYPLDAENTDIKVQMLTNGNMLVGGIEIVGVTSIYFYDAHQLTATPAVAKTCTTDGNSAYWYCSTCKKYFSDEECKKVIEENSWVIPASHEYVNGECTVCHMRESVTYRVPTYNTAGVPTSGIASWNDNATAQNVKAVTSSTDQVTWTAGWYYVSGNVTLTKGAVCEGAVHLILCDGAKLTATNATGAGIQVSGDNNSLTIYAQSDGSDMGKLEATAQEYYYAGIGHGMDGYGQNITINGGNVTANGANYSAGIGGGYQCSGKNITINGGTVTANGGNNGAGIGGGSEGKGQYITINGGTVTANGGEYGAAIGSGAVYDYETPCLVYATNASNITISTTLTTMAGDTENPTDKITNTGTDLASALSGKRYVTIHGTHTYGEPSWTWDGSQATLTLVCSPYGENLLLNSTTTPAVTITSEVKTAATCTNVGTTTYNASVTYNGTQYNAPANEVQDIAINPDAHHFENGECTRCHIRESVTYRVPTYNTAGVPTSGIASWNESATAQNVKAVTSSTSQVTWTAGWYYVAGNVTLTKGAVCSGAVHLILCDGAKLTVTQWENQQAGINVSGDDNSLTIYAQSEGEQMGVLSANGGYEGAGIGGGRYGSGSYITINGGTVTANGGDHGAGIGGGVYRSGSYITINGGAVTANGGNEGAGIGGGNEGSGQNITINGGTVTANGGNEGAGIGGGRRVSGQNITINGGTVTANGGVYAAGIGGGSLGSGQNITINGGTVTATSNDRGGAGIGGGYEGSGRNITINGGTVTANGSRQQSDILYHGPYVYGAGIGNGCDCVVADSYIYISTDLITLAGSSANPTDEILHYGNDISVALAGKPYALVKAEEFEQLATATVTDGETYSSTKGAKVGTLTYKRTVNESQVGKWQALYVPFQMGYDDWCDDFDVATIQNFHDYTEDAVLEVRLVKSGTLMESHPYLIRPKTAGEKTITVQNTTLARAKNISVVCQSMENKYTFTGIYAPMQNLKTSGYLYLTGGQLQQATDDQTMLEAQRWYLAIESLDGLLETVPSGAKSIRIRVLDEESTSIDQIENGKWKIENEAGAVYNLQGQKLNGPRRGVNIINGKKVLVK